MNLNDVRNVAKKPIGEWQPQKAYRVDKLGRRWTWENQYQGLSWQVWQGVKALALTCLTLGIGLLCSSSLRMCWSQAWNGKKRVRVLVKDLPKVAQKVKKAENLYKPDKPARKEIAKKDQSLTLATLPDDLWQEIAFMLPLNEFISFQLTSKQFRIPGGAAVWLKYTNTFEFNIFQKYANHLYRRFPLIGTSPHSKLLEEIEASASNFINLDFNYHNAPLNSIHRPPVVKVEQLEDIFCKKEILFPRAKHLKLHVAMGDGWLLMDRHLVRDRRYSKRQMRTLIRNIAKSCPSLESIKLGEGSNTRAIYKTFIEANPNLEKLELSYHYHRADAINAQLAETLNAAKDHLKTISLNIECDQPDLFTCLPTIGALRTLNLTFPYRGYIPNTDPKPHWLRRQRIFTEIMHTVSQCTHLNQISLRGCIYPDNRLLAKLALLVKTVFFSLFIAKFFGHMCTYDLKIYQ